MDESTRAIVASNLTKIVLKVLGEEFRKELSTKDNIKSQEKRLNRIIKNITDLYHQVEKHI